MKFNKITNIPPAVIKVVKILNGAGHKTYITGGAIRDIVLGRTPHDWDFSTTATPDEIIDAFTNANLKVFQMGIGLGITKVYIGNEDFEIATFRKKLGYEVEGRPKTSEFSKDIAEDLSHRDFTMNCMAYDPLTDELVDPFGGRKDIEQGIIRATGKAEDRFKEDPARVLRAVRFTTKYEFELDKNTANAVKKYAPKLKFVSGIRIKKEIDSLLMSPKPSIGLKLFDNLGIGKAILSEVDFIDVSKEIDNTPKNLDVRWATVLMNAGKDKGISTAIPREIMRRLKFKVVDAERVAKLIYEQGEQLKVEDLDITEVELLKMGVNPEKAWAGIMNLVSLNPEKNKNSILKNWVKKNLK